MKRLVSLFLVIVFAITSCKNIEISEYTVLGDFTPYGQFIERLNGEVQKIVEKNYWAIPEGDSFIKGNPVTSKDRDTLKWTNDFEAAFDEAGDLISCREFDENNKTISKWELSKENNVLALAKHTRFDTLRYYQKLKCNIDGDVVAGEHYRATVDTLILSWTAKTSPNKDTTEYQLYNYKGDPTSRYLYFFNDKGLYSGNESYNEDGDFRGAIKVKCNEEGFMSELTFLDNEKKVEEYNYITYEYDNNGNWIKAIVKDNKDLVVIAERTYTYFE